MRFARNTVETFGYFFGHFFTSLCMLLLKSILLVEKQTCSNTKKIVMEKKFLHDASIDNRNKKTV